MSTDPHIIEVELYLNDSAPGTGNTGGANFTYTFVPDLVHVDKKDTDIVYRISEQDWPRFQMADMYTTDVHDQLHGVNIIEDGRAIRVVHRNSRKQLTIVSIKVNDTQSKARLDCDPQVTNDPPPVF
jgi:hypothetical protein